MGDQPRQDQLDLEAVTALDEGSAPHPDQAIHVSAEPVQGGLFPDDSVPDELVGYRGPSACQIAGITYRQLDYWARTSLVVPSIRSAAGSGSQRLYSFKDILVLKIVKRLLDTGISLHNIRVAVDHLRQRGVQDLANMTLFSDGTTVYECTSAEEVVELVHAGQGVFGISVGAVWREVEAVLTQLPGEPVDGAAVVGDAPSPYLASRLDVALALWRARKIKVFLLSGDNSRPDYNEPRAMGDYLEAHGVPSRLIVLDYAGFDSWETCDRAKRVFGVSHAIVVSQSFHVPRAVYLCRAAGIEAYGVGDGAAGWRLGHDEYVNDEAREILAGVSATYQGLFTPYPTFLGPRENGIAQALRAAGG